jgi:hypothetical protein
MGGGIAALAEMNGQGGLLMAGLGGTLGLAAADQLMRPAKDAGPVRGVMSQSRSGDARVSVALGPVSTVRIRF